MERKISESEINQKIDLSEFYNREPDPRELFDFSEAAIELIIGRSQKGIDINGDEFPDYSPQYADKKGVSVSEVDLTLFGEMLLGIQGDSEGSSVVLSMEKSQAGKAHGNIKGSYGQPTGDKNKARDFFGLSEKEARKIANEVKREQGGLVEGITAAALFSQSQTLDIDSILRNIGLSVDES